MLHCIDSASPSCVSNYSPMPLENSGLSDQFLLSVLSNHPLPLLSAASVFSLLANSKTPTITTAELPLFFMISPLLSPLHKREGTELVYRVGVSKHLTRLGVYRGCLTQWFNP